MAVQNLFLPGGEELLTTVTRAVVGNWINVAAAVVVVYEWLITLDMEIRSMWCNDTSRRPKISTKLVYLMNRYGVVADLILTLFRSHGMTTGIGTCRTVFHTVGATNVLGLLLSEYILALRVCAVWKMNKMVIFFLATTLMGIIVYALTFYYLALRSVRFYTLRPFGGCFVDTQGLTLWISYTLLLYYDTAMVILMGYSTIKEYRFTYGKTELMRRVYDEGVIFYVFLLLIDCISVALQLQNITLTFPTPARILRSILAARTVLHMRDFAYREVAIGSTIKTMSNIRFKSEDEWDRESEVEA